MTNDLVLHVTPRQRTVLDLATQGLTDKEICRELCVSMPTVRTHWIRIRRSFDAVNRAQALATYAVSEERARHVQEARRGRAFHQVLNGEGYGIWEWTPGSACVWLDSAAGTCFETGEEEGWIPMDALLQTFVQESAKSLERHLMRTALADNVLECTHTGVLRSKPQVLLLTRSFALAPCNEGGLVMNFTRCVSR